MNEKKEEEKKDEVQELAIFNSDVEAIGASGAVHQIGSATWLPTAFIFRLEKHLIAIGDLDRAFNKAKRVLIEKYGDRDKDGKLIQPGPNLFHFSTKAPWFEKEYDDLLKMQSTIEGEKLDLKQSEIPDKTLSTKALMSLRCIINFIEDGNTVQRGS